ncbi:hypothetical protein OH77DRAFT_1497753 [Trametes cingulata]|nr:hypothetical protein OH77DRAFT_1497753 [Trametes cingulata]
MSSATATAPVPCPCSVDPASRVDPRDHNPRVVEMVKTPLSWSVLDYFLEVLTLTVAGSIIGPTYKVAFGLKGMQTMQIVKTFLEYTRMDTPAVLVAIVYLTRIRKHLEIDSEDWVCERLALGALITAFKYINDAPVKAEHWSRCSGVFSKADICRIEREFLYLLNFEMRVADADLLAHHDGLMRATRRGADAWRASARSGSVFAHRERAEYRYPIHPRTPAPAHAEECAPAVAQLPDLMYPDSPDSYRSTPPVITPPDAYPSHLPKGASHNPYLSSARRPPTPHPHHPPPRRDAEMDARVRWYAADPYGAPADSPRFEPFSPPTARYERPQEHRVESAYPWRCYDNNATWGPSGLFKI